MVDRPSVASQLHRDDSNALTAQSVVVAVASAVALFTVVGLIVSQAPSPVDLGSRAEVMTAGVVVPPAVRPAFETGTLRVSSSSAVSAQGRLLFTVPARTPVLLEMGEVPGGSVGGESEVWIPPMEPGHHIVRIGFHEVLVTAVDR